MVFFVSYMHIHVPFIMYCSTLLVVYPRKEHDVVGRVSTVVSELHELNQNKEREEF